MKTQFLYAYEYKNSALTSVFPRPLTGSKKSAPSYIYTYIYIHARTHICTYTYTYIHARMHAHIYAHICIYTYIQGLYIYIHTCTQAHLRFPPFISPPPQDTHTCARTITGNCREGKKSKLLPFLPAREQWGAVQEEWRSFCSVAAQPQLRQTPKSTLYIAACPPKFNPG